jgi:hypothetical protein
VTFEEIENIDGTRVVITREEDGTEVFEEFNEFGDSTVSRFNQETGLREEQYEDDYGNMITERWEVDADTGEERLTREIDDGYNNIFVEEYDASGEQIGETKIRDQYGFEVQEEVANDDGTVTVTKTNEDGETVVETWDTATGESSVTSTDADGNE